MKLTSKKRKIIWYLLFSLGLILFFVGLIMGLRSWKEYREAEDFYEEAQDTYVTIASKGSIADAQNYAGQSEDSSNKSDNNDVSVMSSEEVNGEGNIDRANNTAEKQEDQNTKEDSSETLFEEKGMSTEWYQWVQVDLGKLQQINPDVIAWIWFENENISYPVLHGSDNQQYLRTTYEGTPATAGSIFVESMNSPDFSDSHTLIYGHNMHDGTMFGKLKKYRKEGYYEQHAYFQIITLEAHYRYQIFAFEDVEENSFIYQVPFGDNENFAEFLSNLQEMSIIQPEITVTSSDKIITLSTCSSTGRRFVVHAKQVGQYCTEE